MAKLWIYVFLCVALANALESKYDSNEAVEDYIYDDYINLNEKPNEKLEKESSKLENVDRIDDHAKEDNLGEDEKASNDELKDSGELTSDEEDKEDYYDDWFARDDQIAELSYDDASEEISFDADKNVEGLPLPPEADIEKQQNILDATKPLNNDEDQNFDVNDVDAKINENSENIKTSEKETKNTFESSQLEPGLDEILNEESVNKAYDDLNEDLVKLLDTYTWKKLTTTTVDEDSVNKENDDLNEDLVKLLDTYTWKKLNTTTVDEDSVNKAIDDLNEDLVKLLDTYTWKKLTTTTVDEDSVNTANDDLKEDLVKLLDTYTWKKLTTTMVDEDSVNKANDDLKEDLVKLLDTYTWKKLTTTTVDEDSVNKAYDDLNEDLVKLLDTWKKLTTTTEINADDSLSLDDILEYEEKYGRPYKEGVILSQRNNDYEDDNPTDEKNTKVLNSETDINVNLPKQNTANSKEKVNDEINEEPNIDSSLEDAILEEDNADEDTDDIASKTNNMNILSGEKDDSDNISENIESEQMQADSVSAEKEEPKMYLNDALDAQEKISVAATQNDVETMDVSALSPEQYNQVMEQFKLLHRAEMNVDASSVAVIHIPISLDEPVIVTSPNYPSNYPTNNIIDWMFEGDGVGIEFNVTDFAVNGVMGDYLLVKPGGVDESGTDGLLFSYRLEEPRRYRFLDVDRMFVRFVANPGFQMFRGFQFSVKMVAPRPTDIEEALPDPEPELPEPVETYTVILGGIPAAEFDRIQENFRILLADMATLYINVNEINPGLNTTLQVTQITKVAVCNINWPNYRNCSQVTYSVPLVYEDPDEDEPRLSAEDLNTMWSLYHNQDPFAASLRRMGLTIFDIPNDSSVQAVWLVISAGVLLITAILAITLWRYSCVDSYTRMPEPSFRDSGYGTKHGLDLYPTPHQTLPPLYDGDYKWSDAPGHYDATARVDLGGYTNRNFTRDELSDIDTDEDVISKRDRIIVIKSKDGYEV